jgi:hypothetical protein
MKRFLRLFWRTFVGWLPSSRTTLDASVEAQEALARFIFSNRHFSPQQNRVKEGAFLPNRLGEVSVFRVHDLEAFDIWAIGTAVATSRSASLYARGDVRAQAVRKLQLDVVADKLPSRHANIIGWPNDKPKQKILALELAAAATLVVKASGV